MKRLIPKPSSSVEKAYRIFDRVASVADKRGIRIPRLRVLNSKGDPWAVSLPDGYVILSKKAVDMCYQGVSEEEGNARLAFVIGHELGHAADDDFWHWEAFITLSDKPQLRNMLQDSNKAENIRAKEMRADDRG
ncbi:MAG: M48 family metalloprotease, partial [Desulfobacteraceae bacterium]|nr:M48 family metalloprotease [Desulfobacteraceae bacterium]